MTRLHLRVKKNDNAAWKEAYGVLGKVQRYEVRHVMEGQILISHHLYRWL